MDERKLKTILREQGREFQRHNAILEKEFERHTGVLYEKFCSDIRIISEGWGAVKEKTEATFELAGEMKEDVEIIKIDISFIKNALKQKIDHDEFEALEKRVIFLENKLKKA